MHAQPYRFSDDDLIKIVQQLRYSNKPVAHLTTHIRALRKSAAMGFQTSINDVLQDCHARLEQALESYMAETGWDMATLTRHPTENDAPTE